MLFALFSISKYLLRKMILFIEVLGNNSPIFFWTFPKLLNINIAIYKSKPLSIYVHFWSASLIFFRPRILNMQLSALDPGISLEMLSQSSLDYIENNLLSIQQKEFDGYDNNEKKSNIVFKCLIHSSSSSIFYSWAFCII